MLGRDSSYSLLWHVALNSGGGFVHRVVCREIKAAVLKGKFYMETEVNLYSSHSFEPLVRVEAKA